MADFFSLTLMGRVLRTSRKKFAMDEIVKIHERSEVRVFVNGRGGGM